MAMEVIGVCGGVWGGALERRLLWKVFAAH